MPPTRVHLEGMGVVGSLVGHQLAAAGIEFSWHDSHERIAAWRACTGGIYPTGNPFEQAAYLTWTKWAESEWASGLVEQADFWFLSKRPPHGGRYPIAYEVGPLRKGALPSLHLNAQALVKRSRAMFEDHQYAQPADSALIVSHGFGPRLDHYLWGWHAKVALDINDAITRNAVRRPCFYLRTDRYTLSYAYPVPGDPRAWYAGSSTLLQRRPKLLAVTTKLSRWATRIRESTQGLVRVSSVGEIAQGWRPCPKAIDTDLVRYIGDAFHVRPMSHSGVRLAPHLARAVLEVLA